MLKKVLSYCIVLLLAFSMQVQAEPRGTELQINKVLDNWFEYNQNSEPLFERQIWWEKNKKVDDNIRLEYQDLHQRAIKGGLKDWLETPRGTLAYVILIDQFSRHMFRDSSKAYEYDPIALKVTKDAIKKGMDQKLALTERVFLYIPLEHSENIDDQNQSVALFEKLYEETPKDYQPLAEKFLTYAKAHQKIIQQFNRFPHRNKILSRKSTPQEITFLKSHPGF